MADIEAALIAPQARAWLPQPSWASPKATPDKSSQDVAHEREDLALQSHDRSALTPHGSRLAQSWPKWSNADPKRCQEDDSAGAGSGCGARQRLAAARREAVLHQRVQCLQEVVVILEQHVFRTQAAGTQEVPPSTLRAWTASRWILPGLLGRLRRGARCTPFTVECTCAEARVATANRFSEV